MVVVLAGLGIELPSRPAKAGYPIIGRKAGPFAIAPNVPIAMCRSTRRRRIEEPFVLRGSVVEHKIHNDADIMLPGIVRQMLEVVQRAIHRIDVFVIRDVITEVDLGRGIARCDPNGIDPKIFQIIQMGVDALEIANAIIVTIGKAARINFIEDHMLPPLVTFRIGCLFLRLSSRK